MIRKLTLSAVTLSMFAPLVSAEIGFDGVKKVDLQAELSNIEISAPAPAEAQDKGLLMDWINARRQKEWTIMVFGNGKNDLEPYLLKDMNEMEKVGSSDKVNIVVEAGRIDGYDDSDGDWKGVRRYYISKDNEPEKVTSKMLSDLGKVDMGDYKSVIDFAKWAKKAYPAKKYMLIFWNHGAGWTKSGQRIITKGISYDEETDNHINTPQMAMILKDIGGVDVVGTDACLMQMAEVNYEIKDYVKYIVASEETEPGDGYTYNLFLEPVVAKPEMSAMEVGKAAVDGYGNHYDSIDQGYTQSLVLASAMNKLPQLTDAFAAAIMAAGERDLAKSARDGAVNFAYPENKDLYDFARLVLAGTKNAAVKAKGQELMDYVTGQLVLHNRARDAKASYWSPAKQYTLAKGIAVYLPPAELGDGYTDLQWAKATKWDEFANWINGR